MAKNEETAGAPAEAAAPAADKRTRNVTVPTNFDSLKHPVSVDDFKASIATGGNTLARAEFIRKLAATNQYTRSDLTSLTRVAAGDPSIKYQIIFQATKTMSPQPAWPQKVEAAPAPAAAAAPAA